MTPTGSMAVGVEQFEGERLHTGAVYLTLVRERRHDIERLLTHGFPLDRYPEALATCSGWGGRSAVKVAFEFP